MSKSLLNDVSRDAQAVQMSGGGAAKVVRTEGLHLDAIQESSLHSLIQGCGVYLSTLRREYEARLVGDPSEASDD